MHGTGTMGRMAMQEAKKANGDLAEMESIESFKLINPSSQIPIPPPMYFSSQKSGPPTMKKVQKPISVIINTYDDKEKPGKFNFFEMQTNRNLQNTQKTNENVSTRLKTELEKTLLRSNLRKKSDSMVRHMKYLLRFQIKSLLYIYLFFL
jgi:harmonin